MKIRNGFVSNSSSSSFILKLPHYPESYEDMKKMLLGDKNPLVLTHYDNIAFPTRQVIEIIYNDIINELSSNKGRTVDLIDPEEFSISEYSLNEYDNKITFGNKEEYNNLKKQYKLIIKDLKDEYNKKDNKKNREIINNLYEQENDISRKMGELVLKSIKEKSLDTDVYLTLSYSDNDGSINAFIEHSGILDPITTASISHH